MKSNISETDLAEPVKKFFHKEGYIVRSEVKNCDITATKDDKIIVIELKTRLSVDLLIQGVERQRVSDLVYVAVPKPKKTLQQYRKLQALMKRLELGLIFVNFQKGKKRIEIVVEPGQYPFHRNNRKRKLIEKEIKLRSDDYNEGGSSKKKIVTAYREHALHIACVLDKFGEMSPREVKKYGTVEKTGSILYTNFYGWYKRKSRGIYSISKTGKEAILTYEKVSKYYFDLIGKSDVES